MAKLRAEGLDLEVDMMTRDELDQFASQKQLTLRGELTDQGESLNALYLATLLTNRSLGENSAGCHGLRGQST